MQLSLRPNFVFALLLLSLLAAISSGCSRDPNVRKQKYLTSGKSYAEKGKLNEAVVEFSNAIAIDNNFGDAHYELAQTYLKQQDWSRAYQELGRTLESQPENYPAHIAIARLLIAGRNLKAAQDEINLLLEKQPNNPETHILAGSLSAANGDFPAALIEMQKAVSLGPDRWESYLDLALLQVRDNQFDAAETNFKKAVELNPKATSAQLALGNFYQSRGRYPEAEDQYKITIQTDSGNPEPRAALARLYMAEGKKSQTEEFLKQVKHDLPDNSTAYRMLGDFYFAIGDLDNAATEYAQLHHDHPRDLQVTKNEIQLLILKNRIEEAGKLNDELLKASNNDSDGLIYRGEILVRQGHPADALPPLQAAIKNDPTNGLAHYHLGVAFDQLGNLSRAELEWRKAVRLRPDLAEAQRALAAIALRKGDSAALEESATQLISLQPGAPDGYALRAVSFMNRKQFAAAEADLRKAISVAPNNSIGYIQMGNLRSIQSQYSEAEKSYRQALDMNPSSSDALGGLINAYVAEKQTDKAIAAARAQIAKVPDSSAFYDLLGTVLFNTQKDLSSAAAALKKSAEIDKNNSDALIKLGQVQAASGSPDEAIATYQRALNDNPHDARFLILTGGIYESKPDWQKAKDAYQKALVISPDDPVASNDLAYATVQSGGDLDVALSLAQTAHRSMPGSPNAADTLGWVYYQKGVYKSAIDLFQEALKLGEKSKAPDSATIHYHLGLAYEKTNQPALARQHLERVLKINPNYSSAGDVRKVLAQLHS